MQDYCILDCAHSCIKSGENHGISFNGKDRGADCDLDFGFRFYNNYNEPNIDTMEQNLKGLRHIQP